MAKQKNSSQNNGRPDELVCLQSYSVDPVGKVAGDVDLGVHVTLEKANNGGNITFYLRPKEALSLGTDLINAANGSGSELATFYRGLDTGPIERLVEIHGLDNRVLKALKGLGCENGLDILKVEINQAVKRTGCSQQTLRKINLLHRYLQAVYGNE